MAAVFTKTNERDLGGGVKLLLGTLAMDSSYPTNGETVDLSSYFPGGSILFFAAEPTSSGAYVLAHDGGTATAGKIEAYYCDYDAVADGALIEVANTTDLSGITAAKCLILGA
jgi:hypothetical protein